MLVCLTRIAPALLLEPGAVLPWESGRVLGVYHAMIGTSKVANAARCRVDGRERAPGEICVSLVREMPYPPIPMPPFF